MVNPMLHTLTRRAYGIKEVCFGEQTKIEHNVLFLRRDICAGLMGDIVRKIEVDILPPDGYDVYTNTILDVQPLAAKESGWNIGEGVTRVLDGVVALLTGIDEAGEQLAEGGSCEGNLLQNVCFNHPGSIDKGDFIIRITCLIKAGERMRRSGLDNVHRTADRICEEIRNAIAALDEASFAAGCVREEQFRHSRRPGKPKLLLVKEIMGQGAMHEKMLLPTQPCGMAGGRTDIEMGNLPLVLSPLEAIDGAIHAMTCVSPSSKENSRHFWRDPLVLSALADEDLDLCGVVFIGSPAVHHQKFMVSARLGMMAEAMDLAAAIVETEGIGNNHIDFASHMEELDRRGIKVVGMTYLGAFAPLITGNAATRCLVDCAKAPGGIDTCHLTENTVTQEDCDVAFGMLKALLRGEPVAKPPETYSPAVRAANLQKLREEAAYGLFPF